MLSTDEYLQKLLFRYRANFDITKDYYLAGKLYPAYAFFSSYGEKYVLKKEAKLWAIKAFEHVLFLKEDQVTEETLKKIRDIIDNDAEPILVRKNEKYPEKDHMCSYLTFVILTEKTPDTATAKAIKRFSYDKGYLFNFRGHSEAKLAVVSMDEEKVCTNRNGRDLRSLLESIFAKERKTA